MPAISRVTPRLACLGTRAALVCAPGRRVLGGSFGRSLAFYGRDAASL